MREREREKERVVCCSVCVCVYERDRERFQLYWKRFEWVNACKLNITYAIRESATFRSVNVDISFNFEAFRSEFFVDEAIGHVDASYCRKTVCENVFEGGRCG